MQRLAADPRPLNAVYIVADDRVSRVRQVQPDLVRSPRPRRTLHQRRAPIEKQQCVGRSHTMLPRNIMQPRRRVMDLRDEQLRLCRCRRKL